MGKLSLKALGLALKKIAVVAKKYTDLKVGENSVHLYEKATANTGYLKTYILSTASSLAGVTAGNTIGEIDIPKDFLVKGKALLTVEAGTGANEGKYMVTHKDGVEQQTPYEAPAQVTSAGKWIDLVINTVEGDESDQHLCIDMSSFIDTYTNGDGIDLNNKAFSIKLNATASGLAVDSNGLVIDIDSSNANGLSITASGLKLALAAKSTNGVGGNAGAMSALDKENLDKVDLELISDAEIASWYGYDITGTPAAGSDDAAVKTAIEAVSSDSITDEA